MSRQLIKSTAVVSSMTMVSRVLGLVRDILFARIFGIDAATDAFFVAFKIPNFMRRLFAEGAFSQAFVPVLSDYKETGSQEKLKAFVDRTAGSFSLVLFVVTLVGVSSTPLLIMLFAPGFMDNPQQYDLAVEMLRITFPYLFFISLVAFAGGILNSHGKFLVPAFTPVFLNICMITAAVFLSPFMQEPIVALAWGVLAAGLVQLLFQIPALLKLRLLPRLKLGFSDPGVKKILNLMLPAVFGVSVTQINLLLDTLIASFLASGSVSWLYYSDRLVEFPLGIFGVALATVILPNLSRSHSKADAGQFSSSLDWALRLVLLIGMPAAVGLFLLAEPMLSTIFQYDQFGTDDVRQAAKSLMAYSLGLLGFILVKVLVPGFSSRKDMKTPVRFGIYAMFANMVLNIILVFPLDHAGLALATSLGAFFNAYLLLSGLIKHKFYIPGKNWCQFIAKVIVANEIMAAFIYLSVDSQLWLNWGALQRSLNLTFWILCSGAIYFIVLWLLGIKPADILSTEGSK